MTYVSQHTNRNTTEKRAVNRKPLYIIKIIFFSIRRELDYYDNCQIKDATHTKNRNKP